MKLKKHKILIVDDDQSVRNMCVKYFQSCGYDVISASNGKEAVEIEETSRPDLVILDVEMPVMNGFEACKIIRERRSGVDYIPIIFVSGLITEGVVLTGLGIGADDYIRKPYEPLELFAKVKNLLKMKKFIEQVVSTENVVFSLIKSIQARDYYTAEHSKRVADISALIGKYIEIPENEIKTLRESCLLHDIGKIGISDLILNKPGKLLPEEFRLIQGHPVVGDEICNNLRFSGAISDVIRHHHEKLNGSGYPDGLKSHEISKLVKIVTVSDIYDALTTDRPYRARMNNSSAFEILSREVQEGKLDASIVKILGKVIA